MLEHRLEIKLLEADLPGQGHHLPQPTLDDDAAVDNDADTPADLLGQGQNMGGEQDGRPLAGNLL